MFVSLRKYTKDLKAGIMKKKKSFNQEQVWLDVVWGVTLQDWAQKVVALLGSSKNARDVDEDILIHQTQAACQELKWVIGWPSEIYRKGKEDKAEDILNHEAKEHAKLKRLSWIRESGLHRRELDLTIQMMHDSGGRTKQEVYRSE